MDECEKSGNTALQGLEMVQCANEAAGAGFWTVALLLIICAGAGYFLWWWLRR